MNMHDAVEAVLEAVFEQYGHDYRGYARSSVRRRLATLIGRLGIPSLEAFCERLREDRELAVQLRRELSITVSDLFRDASFFRSLRHNVTPFLHTWPRIKIWCAGCATGEEAWSVAILISDEGLLERTQIYATDMSDEALEVAR
jgi:chemotaxis protein methyltransferase CheR